MVIEPVLSALIVAVDVLLMQPVKLTAASAATKRNAIRFIWSSCRVLLARFARPETRGHRDLFTIRAAIRDLRAKPPFTFSKA
jgi:hypothetical protein